MRCASPQALLHLDDLVVDLRVAPGEERAAVDDHVDLVGAELDGLAYVRELHVERRLPEGNAVATDATLTDEPCRRAFAVGTRFG